MKLKDFWGWKDERKKDEVLIRPRYAIVRVDDNFCPSVLEDIDMEFVCTNKTNIKSEKHCKNCRYGDTKEQFERKIEAAITRIIQQKHIVIKYRNFTLSMTIKSLSKIIAEYLGVK